MGWTAPPTAVDGQLMTAPYWNMAVRDNNQFLFEQNWSIGDIYETVDSTNPAMIFGFGEWALYGVGQVLIGLDPSQTEFDTVGKVGGEKTHTLTVAELAAHHHTYAALAWSAGGRLDFCGLGSCVEAGNFGSNPTSTGNGGGGGGAHNNLQPYITVYRWKRLS